MKLYWEGLWDKLSGRKFLSDEYMMRIIFWGSSHLFSENILNAFYIV